MNTAPFAELYAKTARSPENVSILNTLGDYYTARALKQPGRKTYDFYEYIGDGLKFEIGNGESE